MYHRCTGCGRSDMATASFECSWPDDRVTLEHYCGTCRLIWTRQLQSLQARLREITDEFTALKLPADWIAPNPGHRA